MTTYKELADRLGMFKAAEFQEAAAILRSLDAQRPTVDEVMELVDSFGICVYQEGLDDGTGKSANPIYGVEAEAKIRTAIEALAAPVAAQPPFEKDSWQHAVDNQLVGFGRTSQEFDSPHAAVRWLIEQEIGAAQASKPLSEPNLVWNHDDPESPYGGIGEFLNDEWCQTGLAVGDIRRVQRAIRLPDVMVRVTAVSDDGDIDYIVEPVGGIKERG